LPIQLVVSLAINPSYLLFYFLSHSYYYSDTLSTFWWSTCYL